MAHGIQVRSAKEEQRAQWDAAAHELREWWPAFEALMAPVNPVMLSCARLGGRSMVLDVATGFGEPALTIARRLPEAHVVASDLSPAMLAVAAERASRADVTNVELREMDAEVPTLADSMFDAVVCRLGLMFLPDLDAALKRLVALLSPGGRFVAAVWGPAQANLWLALPLLTVRECLAQPPSGPGSPSIFTLGGGTVLADAFNRAGLTSIRLARVPLLCAWSSVDAYTCYHRISPLRRLLLDQEPVLEDRVWREVTAAATRRWGGGALRLAGEVVVVSGTRPPLRNGS